MTDASFALRDGRMGLRWSVALSALLLLTAACGDDDGADGSVAPSGSGWNPDPAVATVISDAGGEQAIPKVAGSGSGGFTVSWFSNPDITNYDVRLQRFDLEGRELWEPGGLVVSDHPSDTFITDYVAAGDADGNTLLVIQDRRSGSNDVHAYKISADGEQLWGEDGVAISDDDGFEAPRPTFVVDADGALTVSFVREVDADTSEVVVQRVDADGAPQWGDGAVVGGASGERIGQSVLADGPDGGVYVAFTASADFATGVEELRLQRIDADGTIAWEDPVALAPELPLPAESSLLPDGSDGVYVAWNDTDLRTNVQHVDRAGTTGFGDGGIQPAGAPGRLQIRPQLVSVEGDPVVVWQDTDEAQSERGVAAQRFDRQGAPAWGDAGVVLIEATPAELAAIAPISTDDALRVYFTQGDPEGPELSLSTRLEAIDVSPQGDVGSDRIQVSSRLADILDVAVGAVEGMQVVVWNERVEEDLDALMQNVPTP